MVRYGTDTKNFFCRTTA